MTETDLDLVWGYAAIARACRCSTDTVARMRRMPGCPIRQLGANGMVFVNRRRLAEWLDAMPISKTYQNPPKP